VCRQVKPWLGLLSFVLVAAMGQGARAAGSSSGWERASLSDAGLSQPAYGVVQEAPYRLTMSDGVQLEARVLRPRVPPGERVPAILHVSPYFGPGISAAAIAPELQAARYVQRGYALVAVTLRGFGGSGGCADYQGRRDRVDMNTILDAVATLPWSNGKLGVIGISWAGAAANTAVVSGNPHLRTVVPVASVTDWWSWTFMRGVPTWYNGYSYTVYAPWLVATGPAAPVADRVAAGTAPPSSLAGRPCPALVNAAAAQEQSALAGTRDPWWDERDLTRLVSRTRKDLAVLQVTGATDENTRVDQVRAWDSLLGKRLPNYRLILGDWAHAWPDDPDQTIVTNPDLHYNRHPLQQWDVMLLRWFDRWLKDRPTGVERLPRALTQDVTGAWHAEDSLQPATARRLRLHPSPSGTLAPRATTGSAIWVDSGDNVDPAKTCAYPAAFARSCVPAREPNALYFTTAPAATALRLVGFPQAEVQVSTTSVSGTVGVTMYDVHANQWTPITYGIASMAAREDAYSFTPMTPGVPAKVRVDLLARDWTLAKGHRLGVGIGSQVGRAPRGGIGEGFAPVVTGAANTLQLGTSTFIDLWQPAATTGFPIR
jgi:putative CocE/NonD family hydrolase